MNFEAFETNKKIGRTGFSGLVASARGCTVGPEAPVGLRQLRLNVSRPSAAIVPQGSLDADLAEASWTNICLFCFKICWFFNISKYLLRIHVEIISMHT